MSLSHHKKMGTDTINFKHPIGAISRNSFTLGVTGLIQDYYKDSVFYSCMLGGESVDEYCDLEYWVDTVFTSI